MPVGPGKYDDLCTAAREASGARGVVLIILDGKLGGGFSVQGDFETQMRVPALLESLVRQIREDVAKQQQDVESAMISAILEAGFDYRPVSILDAGRWITYDPRPYDPRSKEQP